MSYKYTSVFKGALLAIIVLIAGISISFFFSSNQREEELLPAVDLLAWSENKTIILPNVLSFSMCCVNGSYTNNNYVNLRLPDNVTTFELLSPRFFKIDEWLLNTYSLDWYDDYQAYTRERTVSPEESAIDLLGSSMKSWVNTIINNGQNLSITYLEVNPVIHFFEDEEYPNLEIHIDFIGSDNILINIDIWPQFTILYGRYGSLESYGDGSDVSYSVSPNPIVQAVYYLETPNINQGINNTFLKAITNFLRLEL
ncbi:MAG: hypothetical protein HeimC3_02600 [Candidatus Heimdallarchaeota archaeon LC_3]|nr:MAG: hypothetical protein HeimC3_02600 [Candidatus Heimdallarchaeota archaeon LC_3]